MVHTDTAVYTAALGTEFHPSEFFFEVDQVEVEGSRARGHAVGRGGFRRKDTTPQELVGQRTKLLCPMAVVVTQHVPAVAAAVATGRLSHRAAAGARGPT